MEKANSALLKTTDMANLPRAIVISAAIGIIVIGILIAGVGIYPVYKILLAQQNENLRIQSNTIATLIQEYLNRIEDVTRQVTSRTKAREKLEAFNAGAISMDELKQFSIPILNDALNLSNSMLGISRYDRSGKIAVEVGTTVATSQLKFNPRDLKALVIQGPIMIGDLDALVVSAPILDRDGNMVGSDVVTFNLNELHKILAEYSASYLSHDLYLVRQKGNDIEPIFIKNNMEKWDNKNIDVKSIISNAFSIAKNTKYGMLQENDSSNNEYIVTYNLLEGINWLLVLHVNKDIFYSPVFNEIKYYLFILLLITLTGSVTIYIVLHPLSSRLISLTKKLESEINERKEAQQSLAIREHQQAVIAVMGQLALSGIELQDLFDTVTRRTAETLNVDYCKILELKHDSADLLLRSGVGWKEGLVGKAGVGIGTDSQAGYTLQSRKPVVVEDLRMEPRFNGPQLLKDHNIVSGISVIIGNKNPWGVFGVHTNQKRIFTNDDINFIQAIANCLAEAIQRKQAEEAFRIGEERYRALYDDNPSMFFTVDEKGIIVSVNQYGATHLGYKIGELIGQPVNTIFYSEDKDAALQYLQNSLAAPEDIHRWELRKVRHDGSIIWVRETARVVYDNNHPTIFIVCEDISETHLLSEQLSYQASHDPLTGLVNRLEFEHRLALSLESARNQHVEHAMCYLDLDQFKVINDTCGHIAGDQLLKQLSDLLKTHVRKTDVLARLGGDEFGLLMEQCVLPRAKQIAGKLINAIEQFRFTWENHTFNIGVSIGLIPITELSTGTSELLSMADTACYAAKDAGRNRIHIYQEDDVDIAMRHGEMQWVAKINSAIDEDRFQLYVQKIISLKAGLKNPQHTELLLRMIGEDGSIISPGMFLPAAERYNIAFRLDRWVVNRIFGILKQNPELHKKLGICSINISGQSIADSDFLTYIIKQLELSRIRPNTICFEITETAAIANLSKASRFIDSLKKQGCWFALDDFGSGLSSFAYLKTLPVDYLKIDGIFVKDIVDDPADFAMVKSIHEVGKSLNKWTIAEFVENDEIKNKLMQIGIDYAQGYGINRPHPLSDYLK